MKRLLLSTLLFVASFFAFAQQTYTLEKLYWANPWLLSDNVSGLVLNDSIFKGFDAFSDASLSAKYQSGSFKNIYDPSSSISGAFNIDSYSRLGKVFFYGRFGYDYSYMTGSRWRGLIYPYETPFMMADSIPGNLSLEMYNMEAGIGIPLGDKFALGVDFCYNVGIMAKHKDLRNKNTYMDFDISPSFMYNGKNVKAGLSLGYRRNTEKIEYKQIDSSTEKYIFSLYGMWLFNSSGFASAESMRRKENSTYFGSAQIDLKFGEFRLFDSFRADYMYSIQTETGYNNLIHGDVNQLTYSNYLELHYGLQHRVRADVSFYRMLGNKYLQRQELDPDSNVRIWVSYGDPVNCYVRDYRSMDFNYTFRKALSETDVRWEATAGYKNLNVKNKYKESPINFTQNINLHEFYVNGAKYFKVRRSLIDILPSLSYTGHFKASDANKIINSETAEIMAESDTYQLLPQLYEEYYYWLSRRMSASLGFRYGYVLNPDKNTTLYVKGSYGINASLSDYTAALGKYRHQAMLSIGLTF